MSIINIHVLISYDIDVLVCTDPELTSYDNPEEEARLAGEDNRPDLFEGRP